MHISVKIASWRFIWIAIYGAIAIGATYLIDHTGVIQVNDAWTQVVITALLGFAAKWAKERLKADGVIHYAYGQGDDTENPTR